MRLLAALLLAASLARAGEADPLAPCARFVGDWIGDLPGGGRVRLVWEWGVGKRFLRSRTFFEGGGGWAQQYENVVFLHPPSGEVRSLGVDASGKLVTTTLVADEGGIASESEGVRGVYRFAGDDEVTLTASRGGAPPFAVTYRRRRGPPPLPEPPPPAPLRGLAPLARFVGGDFVGSRERVRFEWAFGGRLVWFRAWSSHSGEERFSYEGLYAHDPARGKLLFVEWSEAGAFHEGEVAEEGEELLLTWTTHASGRAVEFRQPTRFLGPDAYEWLAEVRTPEGWKPAYPRTEMRRKR